jgi:hypothetical protein
MYTHLFNNTTLYPKIHQHSYPHSTAPENTHSSLIDDTGAVAYKAATMTNQTRFPYYVAVEKLNAIKTYELNILFQDADIRETGPFIGRKMV